MSAVRQDAWTEEDDLILAEVTLRHIREGSTQLTAFEEVGERIGRTSAACGFRWNSFVRKKYETAIQNAKAQRQKRSHLRKTASATPALSSLSILDSVDSPLLRMDGLSEDGMSIDAVIRFLRHWKTAFQELTRQAKQLERQVQESRDELNRLREENERKEKHVNHVETDYRVVNDDYKALLQIMDRARKLAFLGEEEDDSKARFKMDANGNLERIE